MLHEHASDGHTQAALAIRRAAHLRTVAHARRAPAAGTDEHAGAGRHRSTPRPLNAPISPHIHINNEGIMIKHAISLGRLTALSLAVTAALTGIAQAANATPAGEP